MSEVETCSICTEPFNQSIMTLECGHIYHTNCGLRWLKEHNSCPLCRKNVLEERKEEEPVEERKEDEELNQMYRAMMNNLDQLNLGINQLVQPKRKTAKKDSRRRIVRRSGSRRKRSRRKRI